ncbi:MAG: dienelactone hydrolase family protein [Candidatus Omnitrophica bacterium]|nr:dienelactone hydrolase family protein [Candidatus Omnitrophota bacterium]
MKEKKTEQSVHIVMGNVTLDGDLTIPDGPKGIVLFAHGSGSSRKSPRNRYVASVLNKSKFATLLFDLLTPEEETIDIQTRHLRFDIELLSTRLVGATDWLGQNKEVKDLSVGYFGASTGAAAALVAAVERPDVVHAVVSRGGRPDLAGKVLPSVQSPTLLIVGGDDPVVIDMNRGAMEQLGVDKKLVIVPGASHLFEEPGALEKVAELAADWFGLYIKRKI